MAKNHAAPSTPLDELAAQLIAQCDPAARAILHCLRMLAEEAGSLSMPHTSEALTRAMRACAAESPPPQGRPDIAAAPPGTALH